MIGFIRMTERNAARLDRRNAQSCNQRCSASRITIRQLSGIISALNGHQSPMSKISSLDGMIIIVGWIRFSKQKISGRMKIFPTRISWVLSTSSTNQSTSRRFCQEVHFCAHKPRKIVCVGFIPSYRVQLRVFLSRDTRRDRARHSFVISFLSGLTSCWLSSWFLIIDIYCRLCYHIDIFFWYLNLAGVVFENLYIKGETRRLFCCGLR